MECPRKLAGIAWRDIKPKIMARLKLILGMLLVAFSWGYTVDGYPIILYLVAGAMWSICFLAFLRVLCSATQRLGNWWRSIQIEARNS